MCLNIILHGRGKYRIIDKKIIRCIVRLSPGHGTIVISNMQTVQILLQLFLYKAVFNKKCSMNRRIIVKYTAWTVIQDLLRQCKRKGTANTVFAFNGNSAVHQRQQQLGNGKPQSRAFDIAVTFAV